MIYLADKKANLVRFDEMPKDKLRELSKKGGKASGVARQERRALKDELSVLLSSGDVQQRLCTALIDKATSGDPRAFQILRDTLGEKESEKLELTNGASLAKFQQEHEQEIIALVNFELKNQTEGQGKLFGNLAHCLASKQQKDIALRQYMTEKHIIDD